MGRRFVRDSVRFRILIATLSPVVFVFITLIPVSYYYLKAGFEREIEQRLLSVAKLASNLPNLEYAIDLKEGEEGLRSYEYLVSKLKSVKDAASLKSIFLFDRQKRMLVSSEGDKIGRQIIRLKIDSLEVESVFRNISSSSVLFKGDDGFFYKNAYVPAIYDENGNVLAAIGVSASVTYFDTLNIIRKGLVFIILLSLLLVVLIIIVVSKGISRPIADLIDQAKAIAKGNLESRLMTCSYGELAILIETFEEMRERMLNRDNEMQMMLSGIAHEIRNPLGGLQIMIDLLSEKLSGDADAMKLLNQMDNELKYLNNVVSSFLGYSRKISVNRQPTRIDNLIYDVLDLLAGEIESKNITLKKRLKEVEAETDSDIFKQVLINVVLNAVQAVDSGGIIEIELWEERDSSMIRIKDNGKGIREEDMKNIFKPFFTTKEKGSGLGLALVKKYLNALNGDIQINSVYGGGCEVRISLTK